MSHAFIQLTNVDNDSGISAVECKFDIGSGFSASHRPLVVVQLSVNVRTLGEHAAGGMQILDRVDTPTIPVIVMTFQHPVNSEVRTRHGIWCHGRISGIAQRLEITR